MGVATAHPSLRIAFQYMRSIKNIFKGYNGQLTKLVMLPADSRFIV